MTKDEVADILKQMFDEETAVIIEKQIISRLSLNERMEQSVLHFQKRFNALVQTIPALSPEDVGRLLDNWLALWNKTFENFDREWNGGNEAQLTVQE